MNFFNTVIATLALATAVGAFAADSRVQDASTVKDPAFTALVSPNAPIIKVAGGFGFTEGVTWVQKGKQGYLLFSDIPANVIHRYTPDGKVTVFREKTGYQKADVWRAGMPFNNGKPQDDPAFEKFNMIGSNGMALDPQGRLVIATWAGRTIDRVEHNGQRTVLADRYQGKRFGGPNDVVVRKDGTIYFTDTYGGLLQGDKDPAKEIELNAVYMLRNGRVQRVVDDIPNTNGLAFSPDGTFLYANGSRDRFIRRYAVAQDGSLSASTMFIDLRGEKSKGITDGMKVDSKGNLWTTGPGGIWAISPEGKALGVIYLPEDTTNLVFGDEDRKTLYVSAKTSIYKVRVNVAGLP
ncbi:SMP-30/gluconolactonase/LRE family protein [Acidovorax sp. SUPP2522]|uniref:SMP-30/gluconolactonase/LRE family protein n=1 Tax=unclassified Acidovorax TaxID=2684926 RepID=UPI00234A8CEF|nr:MULTISPECIES: SMP-30/gluconolactonase/LRE family protein [unclassified Acidovorax]WCM99628.1 SMP-30/gluconolactonase/LRE family protein [Acidovorax sp. GBBC 1281]GKT19078.1 SMP-30/gluconolactonase/LRE family protein [Acidovorax sp. SUPP2522]